MKLLFQFFSPAKKTNKKQGLETFGGVYTPSTLTILGVIMYLRFGWVVGNAGLMGAILIVILANSITFFTALSVCAIATDRIIRTGGAYYMISRSLGIETGGAVGIPLYFAQALSVALYTIGFAESVVAAFPMLNLNQLYIALVVTIGVGIIGITSAKIAIKAQYFIMAAIAISLLSFYFGYPVEEVNVEMWVTDREPFWAVFAVFFPAVTGIMAGVNMSGDLRDPIRSLPIGTLAAVGTGFLIYITLPIFLAMRANGSTLIAEPLIMQRMALWGPAISVGVWGATLSSAIGSILGAPRILQALARDGILPIWMRFLGQGSGPDDEPKIGTLVTFVIALAAVCIGDLNLIAPILTMFFLTTYLVLNISAGVEGVLNSPSFRPSFRVHWLFSWLGAIGCLGVMFLIDTIATCVAGVVVISIYFWVRQRELSATWGDVRRGVWMAVLRMAILQTDHTNDTKNWRPQFLVLSGAPTKRWPLIQLAQALTYNRGLITVSSVLPVGSRDVARQAILEKRIRDYLQRRGVKALVRLVTAPDPFDGAERLVETYGLGSIVPNTILLGDSQQATHRKRYCQMIANFHKAQRNVIVLRENPDLLYNPWKESKNRRCHIDVWWSGGRQGNGSLMLVLAYLLCSNPQWRKGKIHLKLVVTDESAVKEAQQNLGKLVQDLRIGATSEVILSNGRSFTTILEQSSIGADFVFLGMPSPDKSFVPNYEKLQQWTKALPTIIFVLAAPEFNFHEVLGEN
ncbi:MAG: transporter, cation-chloride cotransporter (CCC) family [Candidatus Atelocyanobacterium thalassa isolate SIO64986]|uniref:Transporter, cation-chloride cotransporter (CCC) family n=1 Tax=Candidatus Atelocyanobacterium thalassa isolate SIO64986 TaxID=1527444 RepID=A0A086CGE3_9CHRO|nr:MAG: transporter, cation-chloride cotransporter (CCC) family [Candidatus Atelocyanobacterium thalassa isolate SIO64986]